MSKYTVDPDALDRVAEYVTNNEKISDVFLENGIKLPTLDLNQVKIVCPFHNDKGPSLSVNLVTNQYKCFGCTSRGNIINLKVAFKRLQGINANYKTEAELILKKDSIMQTHLGLTTIFKQNRNARFERVRVIDNGPQSFIDLGRKILSDPLLKNDKDAIKKSISLMESGLKPSDVYKIIKNGEYVRETTLRSDVSIDLEIDKLFGGDD